MRRCAVSAWCTEGRSGCLAPGDCDGDGEPAGECGGNDCDDGDPDRFPGHAEICDAAGHDEDCDPETLGDVDADSDGYVDARCCNGDVCGTDCDDADARVRPGGNETCNGRDDDCDGVIDEEGSGTICPGGTCTGGRCSLRAWIRTWGEASNELTAGVAMDRAGNVYVAGAFGGTVDFGGTSPVSARGTLEAYVVAFGADGAFRWVRTYGASAAAVRVADVAVDEVTDALFLTINSAAAIDYGGGPQTGARLLSLASNGEYRWDRALPGTRNDLTRVDARERRVVVTGVLFSNFDFGGGLISPATTSEAYIVTFDDEGDYLEGALVGGAGNTLIVIEDVTLGADGSVACAGRFSGTVDLGGTAHVAAGGVSDAFFLVTTPTLEFAWDRVVGGSGWDAATGVARAIDGTVFASGFFEGRQDLGAGLRGSELALTGYVLAMSPTGAYLWSRAFEPRMVGGCTGLGCGYAEPQRLALDSAGNVIVTGRVAGTINFGSGDVATPDWEVFVASYTAAGAHRTDATYGTIGDVEQVLRIAVGPADSTAIAGTFDGIVDFGSGARSSVGGRSDSFVARLAN